MRNVLVAEAMKLRRSWIWPLVLLAPFGVISLNVVRIALEYDTLLKEGNVSWSKLIMSVNSLLIPALVLGIAILASMVSGMEHRGRMWKHLRALPVSGVSFYFAKFLWLAVLLSVSSILCLVGTLGLGVVLGLGPIPWSQVLTVGIYPYLASYAMIALQLLLSTTLVNQAYSIAVGVIAVIASFSARLLPHWIPWEYPAVSSSQGPVDGSTYVLTGVVLGLLVLVVGAGLFQRKEHH